ncbi:SGNH/GDSL hydrolase family protein [Priestia aryabhattai]|uniref:SGNH/GDSL hydrolase family protein n=1 Tax=Priestia aryabhattai TaxID=412384 RepID=UPI0023AF84C6|nr:SGNH/GDSL hydrolase family protein [Priestia aryabhattai]MDE8675335.1 SGNH/GDSL hydrolase family protein [Priestia aryabhattai]
MKILINVFAILIFISSLVAGKMYWNHQLDKQFESKPTRVSAAETEKDMQTETKNLPESIVKKLEKAKETGNPVKLVIVGSAPEKDVKTWGSLLKEKVEDTYGTDLINVELYEYKQMNTLQFVKTKTYEEITKAKPDILLFEPFLLNDNGVVGIDNTLENLDVVMKHIEAENKNLVTIFQPSAPVYEAKNYPNDVKALEDFSKENGYEFVNHWKSWPDYNSKEITEYLTDVPGQPNEKGEQVWAGFLIHYFTNN